MAYNTPDQFLRNIGVSIHITAVLHDGELVDGKYFTDVFTVDADGKILEPSLFEERSVALHCLKKMVEAIESELTND